VRAFRALRGALERPTRSKLGRDLTPYACFVSGFLATAAIAALLWLLWGASFICGRTPYP
jgi:hypothetical protein